MNEIRAILVDEVGLIQDHVDKVTGKKWYEADTKIHPFVRDTVIWYRQGNREFNSRFVKSIEYRNDKLVEKPL